MLPPFIDFLESDLCRSKWKRTELVHSVTDGERYFGFDIDLPWVVSAKGFLRCEIVEVKTDNTEYTNLFCEIISVDEAGTHGNIVITRAEWLFYCFRASKLLFCIPMEHFRPWFLRNEDQFKKKSVKSKRKDSGATWTSVGRVVP